MRAILIDPTTKTVTEVDYDGNYESIYKWIDAQTFECVDLGDPDHNTVYVDEEGLLADEPGPFFTVSTYAQPLAGKGLILATDDEGESVATTLNIFKPGDNYVLSNDKATITVQFPEVKFKGFKEIPPHKIDHPVWGESFVMGQTPQFERKK